MAQYVDGFVIPIATSKVAAYRKIAKIASKVWMDHGALDYRECVGEDMKAKGPIPLATLAGCRRGETVIFAWITFRSRAHRDRVNAKVMKDPRLAAMDFSSMPFDMKRMAYGGFTTIVSV